MGRETGGGDGTPEIVQMAIGSRGTIFVGKCQSVDFTMGEIEGPKA